MNQYTIEDINPLTSMITVFVSCNGQTYRSFTLVSNINDKNIITLAAQNLYDKFVSDTNSVLNPKTQLSVDIKNLIGIAVPQP